MRKFAFLRILAPVVLSLAVLMWSCDREEPVPPGPGPIVPTEVEAGMYIYADGARSMDYVLSKGVIGVAVSKTIMLSAGKYTDIRFGKEGGISGLSNFATLASLTADRKNGSSYSEKLYEVSKPEDNAGYPVAEWMKSYHPGWDFTNWWIGTAFDYQNIIDNYDAIDAACKKVSSIGSLKDQVFLTCQTPDNDNAWAYDVTQKTFVSIPRSEKVSAVLFALIPNEGVVYQKKNDPIPNPDPLFVIKAGMIVYSDYTFSFDWISSKKPLGIAWSDAYMVSFESHDGLRWGDASAKTSVVPFPMFATENDVKNSSVSGADYTDLIQTHGESTNYDFPVNNYGRSYHPGMTYREYYVPTGSEMALLDNNLSKVNEALVKMGKPTISGSYWTLNQQDVFTAWSFNFDNHKLEIKKRNEKLKVLTFAKIPEAGQTFNNLNDPLPEPDPNPEMLLGMFVYQNLSYSNSFYTNRTLLGVYVGNNTIVSIYNAYQRFGDSGLITGLTAHSSASAALGDSQTGKQNSQKIEAFKQSSSGTFPAHTFANTYHPTGYNLTGWWLPSAAEMQALVAPNWTTISARLSSAELSLSETRYWTSNQTSADNAWAYDMTSKTAVSVDKNTRLQVLAMVTLPAYGTDIGINTDPLPDPDPTKAFKPGDFVYTDFTYSENVLLGKTVLGVALNEYFIVGLFQSTNIQYGPLVQIGGITHYTSETEAVADDLTGKVKTASAMAFAEANSYTFPAFYYCSQYYTKSDQSDKGMWYLPNLYEFKNFLMPVLDKVNASLVLLGREPISGGYWTSSQYDATFVWIFNVNSGSSYEVLKALGNKTLPFYMNLDGVTPAE